jgi:F-type H+-transporting ATPase subunit gamma
MESLKVIRTRIKTIGSIIKATNTMKMVATVKLSRVNHANRLSRQCAERLRDMLELAMNECLYEDRIPQGHWLGRQSGKTLILVLSTNQGFCGPFNQLITKEANRIISETPGAYVEVFGKRGNTIARNVEEAVAVERAYIGQDIKQFTDSLLGLVLGYVKNHGVWDIHVVSGEYKNAITQRARSTQIFPIEQVHERAMPYIEIDGDRMQFLEEIFTMYIRKTLKALVTEHLISEFSARVITMDNSVKNARDMSDSLGILYNRLRQDKITQELTEIVSSTECV